MRHRDNSEHLGCVVPLQQMCFPRSRPILSVQARERSLCEVQELCRWDQRDSSETEGKFLEREREREELIVTLITTENNSLHPLFFLPSSAVVWEPTKTITSIKCLLGSTAWNCHYSSSSSWEILLPLQERHGCNAPQFWHPPSR